MDKRQAQTIAKVLIEQEWDWDLHATERMLGSLGWRRIGSVEGRDDYEVGPCLKANVYHDDEQTEWIEINFDVFADVEMLDDLQYEDKVDEFYVKFLDTTEELAESLDRPVFSDGAAASGFPEDQEAVWLSLWKFPSGRLMLEQKHEDRELPFRLCLVVAP